MTVSLRLLGQRSAGWLFAGMGVAALLAWASEAWAGVLAPSDAVAYPLLALAALALGAWVHRQPARQLAAQRVAVLVVAAYLAITLQVWLFAVQPLSDYALATFTPWVLCAQLLIYASWPPAAALKRNLALGLALVLPFGLATLGDGAGAIWARSVAPVMGNALLAQLCFGAVMYGLSRQVSLLLQLAPDTGGELLSARELVERGVGERERSRLAAHAGERAKSSFLKVISHELRTPLNAVQGFVDVVLRDGIGDTQAAALRQARDGIALLRHRLAQTLEFAQLDDEADGAPPQALRLLPLLQDAIGDARTRANGRDLAVDLVLDAPSLADADGWLMLDAAGLRRVLQELLDNAVRFTQAGRVSLRAGRTHGAAPRLLLEVSDSGVGIDAEVLPRLLSPFTQGEEPLSRRHGGLGLGLALAARHVRRMQGDLQIDSEPGSGTTVRLALPLVVVPLAARRLLEEGVPQGNADAREPDTLAWRRARPASVLQPEQRDALLGLLADHDSAALGLWDRQRAAWSELLSLDELAQVEQALISIEFDRARQLLAARVKPKEASA